MENGLYNRHKRNNQLTASLMNDKLTEILSTHNWEKGTLILILQKIQRELGYISEDAMSKIAKRAKISKNEVFGVASLYTQFKFNPPGKQKNNTLHNKLYVLISG